MRVFAIDFETYYDKEVSITKLGWKGYFNHPQFDPYMVTVYAEDDEGKYEFVGNPKNLDWSFLEGNIALSHNASFDELPYLEGLENGWWDGPIPEEWHCTADMVAYCGHRRSLANSCEEVLGITISKDTRDNMKGLNWDEMDDEFRKEVSDYAIQDSILCLRLWEKISHKWPQVERDISRVNRIILQHGIHVDVASLKKAKETLNEQLFDLESAVPWAEDSSILSRKAFNNKCREEGIEPPASLAINNPDADEWVRRNGKKFAWVGAVRNWRRINSLKKKIESICLSTVANRRCYIGTLYFGAHTGRFSGSGGAFNIQNLPRSEMFNVNVRSLFSAPEGKTLVVVDLSQIEVRTLAYLAGDKHLIQDISKNDDSYETFAVRFGLWDRANGVLEEEDPQLRHKVKAIVLGCGYGAGAKKFADFAGMSLEESFEAVNLYRSKLPKIVGLWRQYDNSLYTAFQTVGSKREWDLTLPSGRSLKYSNITFSVDSKGSRHCVVDRLYGATRSKARVWGGVLAENASQALARDIFSHHLLRLNEEGFKILFHVHDEVVLEADKSEAEAVLKKTTEIMSTAPDWIDLPLEAKGKVLDQYEK